MAVSLNYHIMGDFTGPIVRYDTVQNLSPTEQVRVRQSLGIVDTVDLSVRLAALEAKVLTVASLLYANTIADRDLLGSAILQSAGQRAFVYVTDASADPTVATGWALYLAKIVDAAPVFTKVAEGEALFDTDIDFAALYNSSK